MDAGTHLLFNLSPRKSDANRPCKNRKIKCGEEKPNCVNCERQGDTCDYSIRLNWFRSDVAHLPPAQARPALLTLSSSDGEHTQLKASTPDPVARGQALGASPSGITSSPARPPPLVERESYESSCSQNQSGDLHISQMPSHPSPSRVPSLQGTPPSDAVSSHTQRQSTYVQEPSTSSGVGAAGINMGYSQALGYRDPVSMNQLSKFREYPSPANSNVEASNVESPPYFGPPYQMTMPPPYQAPIPHSPFGLLPRRYPDEGQAAAAEHRNKRMRLSPSYDQPTIDQNARYQSTQHSNSAGTYFRPTFSQSASSGALYSPSRYPNSMPTPATSTTSDENNPPLSGKSQAITDNPDLRRLSVKSLLSDDTEQPDSGGESIPPLPPFDLLLEYGVDRGFPDLDLPKNNDSLALNGLTPAMSSPGLYRHGSHGAADNQDAFAEFGIGIYSADPAHSERGYYADAVTVSIPQSLGELPPTLRDNPMNLLYFHHFLNHTARILVPHDCNENPFRTILPKMALHDVNLLHLLLAYSASHRARLLKHAEPANRIALWVEDIFPSLSRALNDPSSQISNANLATAIMLASLEIISPNTFGVPIPWQSHLDVARRMLMARGGARSIHKKDTVSYFLSRWFAYLDVVGSLSGGKKGPPLFGGDHWAIEGEDDFQIDCVNGFTSRCVGMLARIAELAKQSDSERIDSDGAIIEDWTPSPHIAAVAQELKTNLQAPRTHKYKGCPHRNSNDAAAVWDSIEMVATNEAFHWAGLIHLHRRVLQTPAYDPEVQRPVREIVIALDRVRKGGTAEACLLFPMFTAGCQAREEWQREKLLERLRSVEGSGMTQVY